MRAILFINIDVNVKYLKKESVTKKRNSNFI